jgi:hypothetical protein
MKLLVNVTGLKKIVFNRSVVYKLREQNGNKYWERTDGGGKRPDSIVSYAKMCSNLWSIGLDPKNDTWVHGDTFNAITYAKMKMKSEKLKPKKKDKNKGQNSIEILNKALDAVDAAVKIVENKRRKHPKEISLRGNPKTEWK